MSFINVVKNSFSFLRKKPQIFIPKIVENIVWSFIWLSVATTLKEPLSFSSQRYLVIGMFFLVMIPINVWIFNTYIFLVEQFRNDNYSMKEALIKGAKKFPQSIASMTITSALILVISIPGLLISVYGITNHANIIMYSGYLWVLLSVSVVFITFYLVPASVVTGKKSFRKNFKKGFKASKVLKRDTAILTAITILLLISTLFLEGLMWKIGVAGYLLFRIFYAVVNVYVLLLNPSLLMEYEKSRDNERKLNLLDTKF